MIKKMIGKMISAICSSEESARLDARLEKYSIEAHEAQEADSARLDARLELYEEDPHSLDIAYRDYIREWYAIPFGERPPKMNKKEYLEKSIWATK